MKQSELVKRLRAAKWVNFRTPAPTPPTPLSKEEELASLRGRLQRLQQSRWSIMRHWPFVSQETKATYVADNEAEKAAVEARIRELGGIAGRVRGVLGLA